MILVDTSVWVAHFRKGNARLEDLLNEGRVICHPAVIGEFACGNLRNRAEILSLLHALPEAIEATHEEVRYFIESNELPRKHRNPQRSSWSMAMTQHHEHNLRQRSAAGALIP